MHDRAVAAAADRADKGNSAQIAAIALEAFTSGNLSRSAQVEASTRRLGVAALLH